ncbi:hypothetical protein GSI_11949 [Ganoderma sinense ZZ0214-1]|uniref:Uncharacterized protein n=1 Tax=Ganoderma sinense ZZ0214-1 TaxID=1077348 RepID=A0A2G8RXH6_9APHY|nr:hypothetical protein GSI_11949 [Ganoderma sinense ZZ0214-1]
MIHKISTAFVLLMSALSHGYYVSGAVVSLLVPFADPDNAVTANYLGTDAEGHTSWSVGVGVTSGSFTNTDFIPGTVVADATNAQEVGALSTVIDGVTATITATGECSLATATESGGGASAACSFSGQLVDAASGTTSTAVITTAYTSLQTLLAVQIPDTGSGAIPTAAATSGSGTASSTGSPPTSTSTKNGARKERLGWGVAGAAGLVLVGLV